MRWYPFILVGLIGMAYCNQLLGEHSREQIPLGFEEENDAENSNNPLRIPVTAVKKRTFEKDFKVDKNNYDDEFRYQKAINTHNDKIQLNMVGYDKIKRDFQKRYHKFRDSHNYDDLNIQEQIPLQKFSINKLLEDGNEIDRISYKPGEKKNTDDPPLPAPSSYLEEDYVDETFKDRDELGKRGDRSGLIGCDCKVENDLIDLGPQHFPRYLLTAVCQGDVSNDRPPKCRRGSYCKALEYKVKVLTFRNIYGRAQNDSSPAWLPDDLRQLWKFKTVTIAVGCFCSY